MSDMSGHPPGRVLLNARSASLAGVALHTNALDWIRGQGLTGAKEGCAEGECGACAILVARPGSTTPTQWTALNACLIPALALAGQEVVTVEGIGTPEALHPVQRELAERGGTQCGYCTPGFVASMAAEYYRPGRVAAAPAGAAGGPAGLPADPADSAPGPKVRGFDLDALAGNLCRCTGYRPIRDAALALGAAQAGDPLEARLHEPPPVPAVGRWGRTGASFIRPADLREALDLLAGNPDAVAIAGSTDWGVEANIHSARARMLVSIDQLPELRTFADDGSGFTVGAALTLTEVEHRTAGRIPLLAAMLPRFASRPVRNAATIGGNLATASPIGDCAPVLLALEAKLVLESARGRRVVEIADFFTGYRQTALRPGELLVAVQVPAPLAEVTGYEKVTKRRTDDISSVAVAVALELQDGLVRRARIGLGGVAATPIRARATEGALLGQRWDAATAARASEILSSEGSPMDDHRASAAYRRAMLGQALRRLHADTATRGDDR
jgi:xanthine dehydrogenase small subunit